MAIEDPERDVRVYGIPGPVARSSRARRQVGEHQAEVSSSVHRGPPLHAQGARRLDAPRGRGRAEAGGRRDGGSLGPIMEESGWRLVRTQEGASGSVRDVRAARLEALRLA